MAWLAGVHRWYTKQKLRQAAIAAVIAGAGSSLTSWPTSMALDDVVPAAQQWLTDTLATVRTPRGIDSCGLALKLVQKSEGGRWHKLWSIELPCFRRHSPQDAYHLLDHHIRALPLATYSQATHIELHLVSIGDIVAYHDRDG